MGIMMRLDARGHGEIARWSPTNNVEIKTAEEVFKGHLAKGFKMYDLSEEKGAHAGLELKAFDPEVTEILAVPLEQLEGG